MNNKELLKELIFQYAIMKKFVADVTNAQLVKIDSVLNSNLDFNKFSEELKKIIKNEVKRSKLLDLYNLFKDDVDVLTISKLAIKFLKFKDHIINEKNQRNSFEVVDEIIKKRFSRLGINGPSYKLTMTYDNYSALAPYSDRAFSAFLLSTESEKHVNIKASDPKSNVFQVILDESIMQSGRSNSGGDYEGRIAELFEFYKLSFTRHHHEENDQSQEHDLLIQYRGKTIGVGAKRTLRERYKQYNPEEVDYSIVFTIGEDLNEPKTKTITETYKSFIFVADEIYEQSVYMKNNKMVFKVTDFSINILDQIIGVTQ
jgi:hypothetical protein